MKKVMLSLFMASLMMFSCSSDDSDTIEESKSKVEEIENNEKGVFLVKYSQSGDIENTITVFSITPAIQGQVASNIIDQDDDNKLGNPALINMHERKEGTHTFKTEAAVESILVALNTSIDSEANKDYKYSITVTKDGKEVFNKDETFKIGTSFNSRSFNIN